MGTPPEEMGEYYHLPEVCNDLVPPLLLAEYSFIIRLTLLRALCYVKDDCRYRFIDDFDH